MASVDEARELLRDLGLPKSQANELAALTLLALAGLEPGSKWSKSTANSLTLSKGIMAFVQAHHGRNFAPNTRETFRRQALHQFIQTGLVDYNPDDPSLPTNSPRAHYRLSADALECIRKFGTTRWPGAATRFRNRHPLGASAVGRSSLSTVVGSRAVRLSPGSHSALEIAVVEDFRARFAKDAQVAFLADTASKAGHSEPHLLESLGIELDQHGKLPDVILYDPVRRWLFLIEAVTSHGPMTPKRVAELTKLFAEHSLILVSAFPDTATFRRYFNDLAWETEVWIQDTPDHMIHLNGDRFLGPRDDG